MGNDEDVMSVSLEVKDYRFESDGQVVIGLGSGIPMAERLLDRPFILFGIGFLDLINGHAVLLQLYQEMPLRRSKQFNGTHDHTRVDFTHLRKLTDSKATLQERLGRLETPLARGSPNNKRSFLDMFALLMSTDCNVSTLCDDELLEL